MAEKKKQDLEDILNEISSDSEPTSSEQDNSDDPRSSDAEKEVSDDDAVLEIVSANDN